MKMLRLLICATMTMMAGLSFAECLPQASNDEILRELSRRLNGGPNPGGNESVASYSCDAYGDLEISLVGPTGFEKKSKVMVRSQDNCANQAANLRAHRSRVTRVLLAGICDAYGDLHRFSLTQNGELGDLGTTMIRNAEACLQQAANINQ